MSFFASSALINGLISAACGATVFFLNSRSQKNVLYALYCVSLSVWSFFYFAWQMTDDLSKALTYTRGLMMGAIFIPTFHYHHILSHCVRYWDCCHWHYFLPIWNLRAHSS